MEKKREFDNSFMEINETIDDAETEIVSDTDTVSVDFTEYADETNDETSKKPENNDAASEPEEEPVNIDTTNAAALYTLWFGLDYGSILTAYALYKTVEESGKKPYLIGKPDVLWGEHYADKENIAGKFIYKNCDVVQIGNGKAVKETLDAVNTHIVGSDILWDEKVVGKQAELNACCTRLRKPRLNIGGHRMVIARQDGVIDIAQNVREAATEQIPLDIDTGDTGKVPVRLEENRDPRPDARLDSA